MIAATLDLSAVVAAAEVMQATANTLQKIAKSDRTQALNRALTEFVFAGLERNLNQDGTKVIAEIAPHVFQWKSVMDKSGLVRKDITDVGSSQVFDNTNTFVPTVERRKKLYELKLRKTTASAYIEFLSNSKEAMYDKSVEKRKKSSKGNWGRHHFEDQAEELEKVKTIYKDQSRISERRLNNVKKPSENARIRQMSDSGVMLRFSIYERENTFHKKFEEAWGKFISMYRTGDHTKSESEANKVIRDSASKEVSKIQQQRAVATVGLSKSRAGKLGTTGVRFILGPKGGISAVFPDVKNSAGTKDKEKSIEKKAAAQYRKKANRGGAR